MTFPKLCSCVIVVSLLSICTVKANTNIFSTSFESAEGYVAGLPLIGQNSWTNYGSGGNGIETGWNATQSAYIGRQFPTPGQDSLFLWEPINYNPVAAGTPEVKFSVKMAIQDSSNFAYDNFDWVLYNSQGQYLFVIDFDNASLDVGYYLETGSYHSSPVSFANEQVYTLTVTMNFAANTWAASLDNSLIATNQPLTTGSSPLDIADMDAVWIVWDVSDPGNNAMPFDDFSLIGISGVVTPPPAPPTITVLSKTSTNSTLRVSGENGRAFAIDRTSSIGGSWTPLTTNTCSGGYFDAVDSTVTGNPIRFYRARWVP